MLCDKVNKLVKQEKSSGLTKPELFTSNHVYASNNFVSFKQIVKSLKIFTLTSSSKE